MIGSPQALDNLVDALVRGTRSGAISWKRADASGHAFIAKRQSGTVTLHGYGPLSAGDLRLIVKDRTGKTVDEVVTSPVGGNLSRAMTGIAQPQLLSLYESVREQVTQADSTVRSLTEEFATGTE